MIRDIESISLFSQNSEKLAHFYQHKVGLKTDFEGEMGERGEKVFGFEANGGSGFYIMDHSEVKGKAKEPQRRIINFEVVNIEDEVKRLDERKVKKIQDIYHVEGYGKVATFEDPDGNFFQLVRVRG
jgi:predicted enzyme related to lactoylglutathione lyase